MWLKEKETGFTNQGPGRKLSLIEAYNRLPTEIYAKLGKPKRTLRHPDFSNKGKLLLLPNLKGPWEEKSVTSVAGKLQACRQSCHARVVATTGTLTPPEKHHWGMEEARKKTWLLPAPAVYSAPHPSHWLNQQEANWQGNAGNRDLRSRSAGGIQRRAEEGGWAWQTINNQQACLK